MKRISLVLMALLICHCVFGAERNSFLDLGRRAGVEGGFVVKLGADLDGLKMDPAGKSPFLVQILDSDPNDVAVARAALKRSGLYGPVSVERFQDSKLPYIDNLVNLLVSDGTEKVSMEEVRRVLSPGGLAFVKLDGEWQDFRKPYPDEMDEWTHYQHDAAGTMVSKDEKIGYPVRTQWVGGPKWLRSHEFTSSMHGMVSANGRVFYIIDKGLRFHMYMPARWTIVARDAFSGKILWDRPIKNWFSHLWPMKSGPATAPRRLVAKGNSLYITLGVNAALSKLDAATGKLLHKYEGTKATEEVLQKDDVLYLLVDSDRESVGYRQTESDRSHWKKARARANAMGWTPQEPTRTIMAVSEDSGEILWKCETQIAPLTLTVGDRNVFYYNGNQMVALKRENGKQAWISDSVGKHIVSMGYADRVVFSDGVVALCSRNRAYGFDVEDGSKLWKNHLHNTGHNSPNDIFIINGLVWSAETGRSQRDGNTVATAYDLHTGDRVQQFTNEFAEGQVVMHQRCYPGRATENYLLTSGEGTEMLNLSSRKYKLQHWLRGNCIYGIMPANGLIYKPADSCACFYQSKLNHFYALSSEPSSGKSDEMGAGEKLEKGPAYGRIKPSKSDIQDWPMYRHDAERSGCVESGLPSKLQGHWQTDIGGRLSAISVADGKAFVSAIDRHTLYALNAESGEVVWQFTAGGRIDSPPTFYNGRVIFGSADGWVYCLRSSDGELSWRCRIAPGPEKIVSYQQVESVWPVHGSVLVYNGEVYCLAGRNMFVDGGMHLVRLDALSGRKISSTVMDDINPETGKTLHESLGYKALPVANPDILSCDGNYVYLKSQKISLGGKRVDIGIEDGKGKSKRQRGENRHLFCPTGFLDDAWFHRSFWIYGLNAGEGHGLYTKPAKKTAVGRIMTFDEDAIYGLRSSKYADAMHPRPSHYLYAAQKKGKTKEIWRLKSYPVLANAMALAKDKLVLAGPRDLVDEGKAFGYLPGADEEINRQLLAQEKEWQGENGSVLRSVSLKNGETIFESRLSALPVWDGMAIARNKLYISLQDGTVVCVGE